MRCTIEQISLAFLKIEKISEAEPMNKLKLIRLFSLDAIAVISAVALCVILVTDPSLLG